MLEILSFFLWRRLFFLVFSCVLSRQIFFEYSFIFSDVNFSFFENVILKVVEFFFHSILRHETVFRVKYLQYNISLPDNFICRVFVDIIFRVTTFFLTRWISASFLIFCGKDYTSFVNWRQVYQWNDVHISYVKLIRMDYYRFFLANRKCPWIYSSLLIFFRYFLPRSINCVHDIQLFDFVIYCSFRLTAYALTYLSIL